VGNEEGDDEMRKRRTHKISIRRDHRTTTTVGTIPLKRVTSLPNQFPIPLHQSLRVRDDLFLFAQPFQIYF